MSGHTPGPWHIAGDSRLMPLFVTPNATDDLRFAVATAPMQNYHPAGLDAAREEARANAHLIAASPALLAACKALLATALKVDDLAWSDAIARAGTNRPCDLATAAIRAAEGE